mmetsp:Transcript_1266/g.2291  ORF Transcript_1266/g.2291 Transcript_1266/m.2291 type:complete len:474 (-) Transcript_1266:82-1503(-)
MNDNQNQDIWSEVRLSGKLPERRSNHCSFIVNDYLYIHGGRDIKEGPMLNMWRLSIDSVKDLMDDPECGAAWEPVNFKGVMPGNISHHRPAVFGHSVVIFGGIKDYDNNPFVYEFDSHKLMWSKMTQSGEVPKPCDDHSLSQIDEDSFLIFGGFVEGSRVNECYVCRKKGNSLEWKHIGKNSAHRPCIRASHSSVVHNGKCYIFGGQDDENNKLNDLWVLDLTTEEYQLVDLPAGSYNPPARSGHSANIYNGKMYIFGGILELTKELNEMLIFDFNTMQFSVIGGTSSNEDLFGQPSHAKTREDDSPGLKKGNTATKQNTYGSPSKTGKSPSKLTAKARRAGKSPTKKVTKEEENKAKKESGLASPTSVSMQNSFIIKNADESFDAYYTQMRKRKLGGGGMHNTGNETLAHSATIGGPSPGMKQESHFGVVPGIQPAARDGHSTDISDSGFMFVFGGDRHHMPFNDLYLMKLD